MESVIRESGSVFVPCAISSFFEICDSDARGVRYEDPLKIGARGGGFILGRGSTTQVEAGDPIESDFVRINGRHEASAKTSLRVLRLMRERFGIPPVRVSHAIEPPIGLGFGTSGSGAIGTAIATSDLFDLRLTLTEAAAFAHIAEIDSVTGLGTVISLVSGTGAVGLVTEPGCFAVGHVDCIVDDIERYSIICACFGPIEKSTVLNDPSKRERVNAFGRQTMDNVVEDGTVAGLLKHSRIFAEKTGLASSELLKIADKAVGFGAVGATQNMIGNAVHCLVLKERKIDFLRQFERLVPRNIIFESGLCQTAPRLTL